MDAKKRYQAFKTGVMDSVNLRPIEYTLKFPYDEELWGDYQAGYQQGFKIRQQISEMAEQYAGHKEPVVTPFSDLRDAIKKARGGEASPQHKGFA